MGANVARRISAFRFALTPRAFAMSRVLISIDGADMGHNRFAVVRWPMRALVGDSITAQKLPTALNLVTVEHSAAESRERIGLAACCSDCSCWLISRRYLIDGHTSPISFSGFCHRSFPSAIADPGIIRYLARMLWDHGDSAVYRAQQLRKQSVDTSL